MSLCCLWLIRRLVMKGWSYVYTGANQPFEAREYPVPEVDGNGILVRVMVSSILSLIHI